MELNQLWCRLAAPDFDLYTPSDNYFQRILSIEYFIANKLGFNIKDTRMYLNRKRVMEEQKMEYYMNQEKTPPSRQ